MEGISRCRRTEEGETGRTVCCSKPTTTLSSAQHVTGSRPSSSLISRLSCAWRSAADCDEASCVVLRCGRPTNSPPRADDPVKRSMTASNEGWRAAVRIEEGTADAREQQAQKVSRPRPLLAAGRRRGRRTLAQVRLEDARDRVRVEVAGVRQLEVDVGAGVELCAELDDCGGRRRQVSKGRAQDGECGGGGVLCVLRPLMRKMPSSLGPQISTAAGAGRTRSAAGAAREDGDGQRRTYGTRRSGRRGPVGSRG